MCKESVPAAVVWSYMCLVFNMMAQLDTEYTHVLQNRKHACWNSVNNKLPSLLFQYGSRKSTQNVMSAGIRQLAVLLRGALTVRSKEGFREVYCWQTVNCLELWAKVLAAHADKQVWVPCPTAHP